MSRIRECIDILDDWRNRALAAEKYAKEADAQINHLTAALAAANEDAERLAVSASDGCCCILHDRWLNALVDNDIHDADCPIILHRARCAKLEGGESVVDSPKEEAKG